MERRGDISSPRRCRRLTTLPPAARFRGSFRPKWIFFFGWGGKRWLCVCPETVDNSAEGELELLVLGVRQPREQVPHL